MPTKEKQRDSLGLEERDRGEILERKISSALFNPFP